MTTPDDRIDAYIARLVEGARPVRRLWTPRRRLAAWLGGLGAVAAAVGVAGLRPDLATRLAAPGFVVELACLAVATLAAGWIALRGAVPGLDGGRGAGVLAASALTGGTLGLLHTRLSLATPLPTFVDQGWPCIVSTLVLTVLPAATLLWAVRRGVALRPAVTGAAAGLGASLAAYALMRLRCPLEDTLHVIVWHGGAILVATLVAAALGAALAGARAAARPPR